MANTTEIGVGINKIGNVSNVEIVKEINVGAHAEGAG